MPAPKLSKSSLSNALAALKEHGFAPSHIEFTSDGGFAIDIETPTTSQDVPKSDAAGPKKWGAKR